MFDEVVRILKISPEDRTAEEIKVLLSMLEGIKFFQNQNINNQFEIFLNECQKQLKLEKYEPGQFLFKEGDKGDRLFIVLKGIVEIYKQIKCEPRTSILSP